MQITLNYLGYTKIKRHRGFYQKKKISSQTSSSTACILS